MTGVSSNDFSTPLAAHNRLVFLSDEVRSTPTELTADRRRLCSSSTTLRSAASMRDRDFDVRAFHDELLGGGALPLDLLEQRMDAWLATTVARPADDQP